MKLLEMKLLEMSFSGAILILAVTSIRTVFINKLPKAAFTSLWGIVLLRLLLPFSIPSAFSIYSWINQIAPDGWAAAGISAFQSIAGTQDNVPAAGTPAGRLHAGTSAGGLHAGTSADGLYAGMSAGGSAAEMPADEFTAGTPADGSAAGMQDYALAAGKLGEHHSAALIQLLQGGTPVSALFIIWCAGTIVCAACFTVSYLRCRFEFMAALPVSNAFVNEWQKEHQRKRAVSIRQSDRIAAPLTYGFFHPVILMPKTTDWENTQQLQYVLLHEYVHICRCDAVTKLIAASALCIHWFNPMVWVMYLLFNRDIELACDECVVQQFGENSKSAYALTLIGMEEKKSGFTPFCSNFNKNAVEERIRSIMNYKKKTYVTIIAAMLLTLSIGTVFATSAKKTEAAKEAADCRQADQTAALADSPEDSMNTHSLESNKNSAATVRTDKNTTEDKNTDTNINTNADTDTTINANADTNTKPNAAANAKPNAAANAKPNAAANTNANADINTNTNASTNTYISASSKTQPNTAAAGTPSGNGRYTLTFTIEGMTAEEPADLHIGTGYCILMPSEGWRMDAPDAWRLKSNSQVQLWLADFGTKTEEQAAASLAADGFSFAGQNHAQMQKTKNGQVLCVKLKKQIMPSGGWNVWGVFYAYPAEDGEGFGARLPVIADSFTLLPSKNVGELSMDGKAAAQTVTTFWQAYLSGDKKALKQCLAKDYSAAIEVFPDGSDMYTAKKAELTALKGLDIQAMELGDRCSVSAEFKPGAEDAACQYLAIELVKEQSGWKIGWYGLEG